MIEQLKKKLRELAAQIERSKKIESMLESLYCDRKELTAKESELKSLLSKEQADALHLEKTTLTSLLYSVLGRRDVKLDKEQREAYAAKLKYDAASSLLEDCQNRIDSLVREKQTLSDCESRYEQVCGEMQEILGVDPRYSAELCGFQRGLGEIDSQLHELDEAMTAGNQVLRIIESIEENLDSAEECAKFDLLGFGLIADLEKHASLDAAQEYAEYLQALLSQFRTELADVNINPELGAISIDGFLRFADFFFDGFFADLSVIQHIDESIESVYEIRGQVEGAINKLETMKARRNNEKIELERKMTDFLMKA